MDESKKMQGAIYVGNGNFFGLEKNKKLLKSEI